MPSTERRRWSAAGLLLGLWPALLAAVEVQPMTPGTASPRIANGVGTTGWPTVVSLQLHQRAFHFCSGVLVDCQTVLTAAHCFCGESSGVDGASCQPGNDGGLITSPGAVEVFFQNAPPLRVTAVQIPLDYEFAERRDVALLNLAAPVEGLRPRPINTVRTPAFGTTGLLVGYGQSDQRVVDFGVKRMGEVTLGSCAPAGVPGDQHLCWDFPGLDNAGDPGTESNTCPGDSGGPMWVDFGTGALVAGITSGGINVCQSSDTAFDTDVHANRDWLQGRLGASGQGCGQLPAVGDNGTTVFAGSGRLDSVIGEARYSFSVAAGTQRLRVALNGDDQLNLDLEVSPLAGGEGCLGQRAGVFEFCEFHQPSAGTWEVVVRNVNAVAGEYQVVSTLFDDSVLFRDGFESGE